MRNRYGFVARRHPQPDHYTCPFGAWCAVYGDLHLQLVLDDRRMCSGDYSRAVGVAVLRQLPRHRVSLTDPLPTIIEAVALLQRLREVS